MLNNNGISNSNKSKFMAPRPEGVKPTTVVITYSVCNNLEQTINALQKKRHKRTLYYRSRWKTVSIS